MMPTEKGNLADSILVYLMGSLTDDAEKEDPVKGDAVNHPNHYCTGKYECIDVMVEVFGVESVKCFCICNAFKYIFRHMKKNGTEDIQKAIWYLEKYIELEEKDHEKTDEINSKG